MILDNGALELMTAFLEIAVHIVEIFGILVIVLEVFRTGAHYMFAFFGLRDDGVPEMRLRLGQSLVMGLEFLVAADILKTSLSPTWNDIGLLAALVALRTVLNFFLERELQALIREEEICSENDALND